MSDDVIQLGDDGFHVALVRELELVENAELLRHLELFEKPDPPARKPSPPATPPSTPARK